MNNFQQIKHFQGTRNAAAPMVRVENIRAAAGDFRKDMLQGKKVRFFSPWI